MKTYIITILLTIAGTAASAADQWGHHIDDKYDGASVDSHAPGWIVPVVAIVGGWGLLNKGIAESRMRAGSKTLARWTLNISSVLGFMTWMMCLGY